MLHLYAIYFVVAVAVCWVAVAGVALAESICRRGPRVRLLSSRQWRNSEARKRWLEKREG